MFRKVLIAFALVAVGASSLAAQDRESRRAEQEARIRELRRELAQLESEAGGFRSLFVAPRAGTVDFGESPLAVMFGVNRARLGVVVQTRRDASVDSIGALIEDVTEGAAAAEAGLQAGDLIIAFDGERLTGQYPPASDFESEPAIKLIDLVREHEPGDTVVVSYRRGRNEATANVVLDEAATSSFSYSFSTRDGEPPANWITPDGDEPMVSLRGFASPDIEATLRIVGEFANMELVSLNEELGAYFGTDQGVLVITAPDEGFGLQGGDVILQIGARNVDDPSRVFRILSSYEPGEEVTIEVMRNQNRQTITGIVPERGHGVYRMRTERP